jgi:PKHD-type hydroxylase
MFMKIYDVLTPAEIRELHQIADRAAFVDGRTTNPHITTKNNLQINDPQPRQRSAQLMAEAMYRNETFRNFAFPKHLAPPMMTLYRASMKYGLHADAALMKVGPRFLRSDLSCTLFLSELDSYDGGALRIQLGTQDIEIRLPPGALILYPSTTLHEVTPVTRGERRVGITFIESRIADPLQRETLYELNEVAALEGLKMEPENFMRLQRVQQNLLRSWADPDG